MKQLMISLVLPLILLVLPHFVEGFTIKGPQLPALRSLAASPSTESKGNGRRILIVGGGIGGVASAYDARHILDKNDEIVLVSDQPDFSFTPSNPWVAVRKRTPSDIQVSLSKVLPRHGIEFVHDKATRLEPGRNRLHLASGTKLDYDYLIIATGPRLAFHRVPGLQRAGVSVCTTPHAVHAAEAVDKLVQEPGPVVVGAAQGASCFGPAYEFALLLQHELIQRGGRRLADQCPMTFVTPEPMVGHMGLDGAGDSKQILKNLLTKNKMTILDNTRTLKATSSSVSVEKLDDTGKVIEKKRLPSKLTMMIPPFEGQDVWKQVSGLTDAKGLIVVNEHQQSPTFPNIFAVGVAVSIPQTLETILPCGVPKTGYLIESQGTAAVHNIKTLLDWNREGAPVKNKKADDTLSPPVLHCRPHLNALCITDFGNDGAIFVTMPQQPPRRHDWTIHSKLATLAKIAFEKYFLHKVETGDTDPYYEKYMLKLIGVERTVEEQPKREMAMKE